MASSRRTFLKEAATAVAAGAVSGYARPRVSISARTAAGPASLDVRDGQVHVETGTLTAVIDKGLITSLKSKATGESLITGQRPAGPALQLVYRGSETVPIDENRYGSIQCRKLSDRRAEIIFHNWDAGEGLNEITAQGQSFAQVHLFRSWQDSAEGLARTGGCPLNEFLLGKLCRSFGYSSLSGRTEQDQLRMRIREEHGAIPTITIRSAREITDPNPAVKQVLDQAAG